MVALAPRPDSELVPSPGAVLQWRCRRLQRKGQSDHQTGVWVPHLRGTGSRFVSRTWRPARTKTHPQILLTRPATQDEVSPLRGVRQRGTVCRGAARITQSAGNLSPATSASDEGTDADNRSVGARSQRRRTQGLQNRAAGARPDHDDGAGPHIGSVPQPLPADRTGARQARPMGVSIETVRASASCRSWTPSSGSPRAAGPRPPRRRSRSSSWRLSGPARRPVFSRPKACPRSRTRPAPGALSDGGSWTSRTGRSPPTPGGD